MRSEIRGFERVDSWDYEEEDIREALLNAVVHRDYSRLDATLASVFAGCWARRRETALRGAGWSARRRGTFQFRRCDHDPAGIGDIVPASSQGPGDAAGDPESHGRLFGDDAARSAGVAPFRPDPQSRNRARNMLRRTARRRRTSVFAQRHGGAETGKIDGIESMIA